MTILQIRISDLEQQKLANLCSVWMYNWGAC